MSRPLQDGRHAAAVSIRSGAGSGTHDRVLRFAPLFDSGDQAIRYAADQARAWLHRPETPSHRSTTETQE